jgi:acetyl esterase/lipase
MGRIFLPVAAAACFLGSLCLPAQDYPHEGESRTIRPNPLTGLIPIDRSHLTRTIGAGVEGGVILDEYMLASDKPHPIAIVVHGGGYTSGSKRGENEFALTNALLDGHFSVFTVAYHLAPEANQELMVREIQRTVRYARSNADRLHLDPDHIVLVGEQVGGLLAAAAALAPPSTEPRSHFSYDLESDAVQAVVAIGCAGDFGKNAPRPRDNVYPEVTDRDLFKTGLPKYFPRNKDVPIHPVDLNASPRFRPDAPAVLVIQGSSRNDAGCTESTELYASLQNSGDQVKLIAVSDRHPAAWTYHVYEKPLWQKDMMKWLKTTLATSNLH